jgi:hypothetical protein
MNISIVSGGRVRFDEASREARVAAWAALARDRIAIRSRVEERWIFKALFDPLGHSERSRFDD